MKKILVALMLPIIGYLAYYGYTAYVSFKDSDYEAQGFLVCNEGNTRCENSQHIHANIEVVECGKQIYFEKEKGSTNFQHTHKEQNRIHWHARELVDPITREPLDKTPRQLKSFFEQVDYKGSDSCWDTDAKVTLFINGAEKASDTAALEYIWGDEENLKLVIE